MEEKFLKEIELLTKEHLAKLKFSTGYSDYKQLNDDFFKKLEKIIANYKIAKSTLEGLKDVFTSIQNEIEKSKPIPMHEKNSLEHEKCSCTFDDRERLVRMCLSCNNIWSKNRDFEKELDKKNSELNLQKPKLTVKKSDKVFIRLENDYIEINGVRISKKLIEQGKIVIEQDGSISFS